ncbi:prepilin-type N-terminal cleavage/methylation domain-containing protein [Candidatus Woesebacteria bacterium]|nr:prepilin-type N-terminal cleavage/methylation domain-containing protein [Candidatus Woesebacteria bacterium]
MRTTRTKVVRGYSLFELMVVMTLFAILMLVATQSLLLSLKSSTKSESLGRVKENLEYVISVMERQLHSAKSVYACTPTCISANTKRLDYINQDGIASFFSCTIGADGYIASGSARITSDEVAISDCSFTCCQQTGTPPEVMIKVSAEDKTSSTGEQKARATTETRVLLRQY